MRLTQVQIKLLKENDECPSCGETEIIETVTAPEEYVCEGCGWSEFVEAVEHM